MSGHVPQGYFGLQFEPYEYREYPKWVECNGKKTLVGSAFEENELRRGLAPVAPAPAEVKPLANVDVMEGPLPAIKGEEKAVLIQIAEERNVPIDKRWSAKKIRAAIEARA